MTAEQATVPCGDAPIEGADALFEAYADTVYRLALLRTRSAADADDVLQEVFLRCLRYKAGWANAEHQKAWMLRVTINCSKSLLTSAWRRNTIPEQENLPADAPADLSDVYAAVLALREPYRTVVHLHYYEGYKVEEIAKLMTSNVSTVKSWLFRARDMLRQRLKGDYNDV